MWSVQLRNPVSIRDSPTIVNLVCQRLLCAGWNLGKELHRLAVELLERIRILDDIPACPAIEMFDYPDFDRRALVISHLDFKRFVDPPCAEIGSVFCAVALSGHVKCI